MGPLCLWILFKTFWVHLVFKLFSCKKNIFEYSEKLRLSSLGLLFTHSNDFYWLELFSWYLYSIQVSLRLRQQYMFGPCEVWAEVIFNKTSEKFPSCAWIRATKCDTVYETQWWSCQTSLLSARPGKRLFPLSIKSYDYHHWLTSKRHLRMMVSNWVFFIFYSRRKLGILKSYLK